MAMASSIIGNCFVAIFALFWLARCEIPEYIQVCPHDHPNVSACIIDSIEKLKPHLKVGIDELGVPGLEPFALDPVSIDSLGSATRIATNITNLKIWGASDFRILKLTSKLTKNGHTFRYRFLVPKFRMEGTYAIDSKLLFVNLQGTGPFVANVTNYEAECILKGEKVERNGTNHLLFEEMKCNIGLEKATIHLDNLFGGNQLLGDATNDVLNDNAQVLFEEIKPAIRKAVERRFTDISNKITLAFKYEELFP